MIKNMLRNILLLCIMVMPFCASAQNSSNINRKDLLDKTWYFLAQKCPPADKDNAGGNGESQVIRYSSNLKMTASNVNNINHGNYVRMYKDNRDNPRERGTYAITTDDAGNVLLVLKKAKTDEVTSYQVAMVETNHMTLVRTDGKESCNVFYAIAP